MPIFYSKLRKMRLKLHPKIKAILKSNNCMLFTKENITILTLLNLIIALLAVTN